MIHFWNSTTVVRRLFFYVEILNLDFPLFELRYYFSVEYYYGSYKVTIKG
jgi:hypothetical protein